MYIEIMRNKCIRIEANRYVLYRNIAGASGPY